MKPKLLLGLVNESPNQINGPVFTSVGPKRLELGLGFQNFIVINIAATFANSFNLNIYFFSGNSAKFEIFNSFFHKVKFMFVCLF